MTSRTQEEWRESLRGYRVRALQYLSNAGELLGREEWEKGAELVWGAFAEAVKAFALSKDRILRNHDEVRRFARDVGRELNDSEISDALVRAERLHSDFYEGFLDPQDIAQDTEYIKRAIGKLLQLAKEDK